MIDPGKILDLTIRRKIYNFILKYPGLHLREISRKMDISYSTLKYHLNFLEKRELINKKSERRYNKYYVSCKIGRNEKKILGILQESTPRHIIFFLLVGITSHQNEISKYLEKHPTTIEFHLKKLLDLDIVETVNPDDGLIIRGFEPGIIVCESKSNKKIYILKDPWKIYNLLVTYEGSLIDDVTSDFILDFVEEMLFDGIPATIDRRKDAIDRVLDMFFEVFPPPYRI